MTTWETEEVGLKLSKVAELHQRVLSAGAARLADWKIKALELQAGFSAAEADIQSRFRRLADRESEIGVREKNLEAKELELESSESQLLILKNSIAENVSELGLVEMRVAETKERAVSVEKSLEEKEREVEVKEARVRELEEREAEVTAEMEARKSETAASKRDLHSQKSVISKNVEQLERLLEVIREKNEECKKLEIHALEMKSNETRARQLEVRVGELEEREVKVKRLVDECEKELSQLREEVVSIEKSKEIRVREMEEREVKVQTLVDECEKELEMKRGELCLVENSVAKCSTSLETIKREMGLRGKEFYLLRKSMVKWCSKLEKKKRELEGVFERFETRGMNLEPNVEELLSIEKRVGECLKDLELREKSLADSVSDELKMKELQVKQMELEREKHAASLEKPKESVDAHLNWQLEEEGGEVRLQLQLSGAQHLEREDPLCFINDSIQEREEQFNALKKSAEEQRKYWESFSHRIQIKERQCKLKLKHSDSQANIELLEYTPAANDMIIPSSASDEPCMIMDARSSLQFSMNEQLESVEQAEAVLTNEIVKLLGLFGGDPQVSALLSRDEIAKLLNVVSLHKTQKLCQTHGVEKKIIDIIEFLIGKKKLVEAVRFICTFELGDKFPPVPLLKELVMDAKKCCNEIFTTEKSNDEKEKVVDGRIADLRAAIKCIEDYRLESQYPSVDIEMAIQTLGILKQNQKAVLALPSNAEIHEQKKGRKRSPSTSAVRSNYKLRNRMSSLSPSSC